MLIPNHPDDERLSALASGDDDATADTALTSHVSTCIRCTEVMTELGALRASLADLPDVAPSRPLQLLPPVTEAPAASGGGGWVRRLFAPAMTAGAVLAMVGLVGTTAPLLGGMASSGQEFQNVGQDLGGGAEQADSSFAETLSSGAAEPAGAGGGFVGVSPEELTGGEARSDEDASAPPSDDSEQFLAPATAGGDSAQELSVTAERSPWPMVLFAGIALMIGVLLLRWILVPRAG